MPWRKQVEQWRQYAIWEGQGAPPDLLLSIIRNESGGIAGRPANVGTKFKFPIPLRSGGTRVMDRAYGLMQCIPAVILDYNKAHPGQPVYFDDMAGKTHGAGRLQIRVGAWLYNKMVRRLHHFYPERFPGKTAATASEDQLILALVAYAIGLGALLKRLDVLKEEGKPFTIEALNERFPLWGYSKSKGKWINRPLHYGGKVWARYLRNRTNDPGSTDLPPNPGGQPGDVIGKKKPMFDVGYAVPIMLILAVWVMSSFWGKRK